MNKQCPNARSPICYNHKDEITERLKNREKTTLKSPESVLTKQNEESGNQC